jgi:hypothetical protein
MELIVTPGKLMTGHDPTGEPKTSCAENTGTGRGMRGSVPCMIGNRGRRVMPSLVPEESSAVQAKRIHKANHRG